MCLVVSAEPFHACMFCLSSSSHGKPVGRWCLLQNPVVWPHVLSVHLTHTWMQKHLEAQHFIPKGLPDCCSLKLSEQKYPCLLIDLVLTHYTPWRTRDRHRGTWDAASTCFFGDKLQQQKVEEKDEERSSKNGARKKNLLKCMYKHTYWARKNTF